ncbi:RluA family pseudouridine synthase [Ornithinibacillus halophilus]|uniref:Pseudouridine synthase n=1 Tax=Ornithinibacillus halophilus TaxID=930117 RepID=A0A1M5IQU2_9BACI|nr:RluA family pseudouridine synthase [Ornithinibacillus halophilus]SHG30698.1 23S rRNA pseudouridine1911/1915/1917 synthase [Ornithinibacillus halophilus]
MEWKINEQNEGMTIREFLQREHQFSRRIIKAIIYDGGKILVNHEPKTVRYVLKSNDELKIVFPPESKGNHMYPENLPLDIVYEDSSILIVNKRAGIATIPSSQHQGGTVANAILAYYEKQQIPYTVHVVTRLDRDTSGLLLIAKSRYIHSLLSTSQKQGNVSRKYQAIVEGIPVPLEGVIDEKIGRKEGSIIEREVRSNGQRAVTHYKVMETNHGHALVDVVLETGRTHQIRVHFSHIKHPLAGDDLYGGSLKRINRQALHCYQLQFIHPITKKSLIFTTEIPEDMKKILAQ